MSPTTAGLKYVDDTVHDQKFVFVNELGAFMVVWATSCVSL